MRKSQSGQGFSGGGDAVAGPGRGKPCSTAGQCKCRGQAGGPSLVERSAGGLRWMWLWRVRWVQWSSMAASMRAVRALFAVVQGCGGVAPMRPPGRDVSSSRSRFGDSGVSIDHQQIVDLGEGGGSNGGRRRALHDPIGLLIVVISTSKHEKYQIC